jgi:hypothetical protein
MSNNRPEKTELDVVIGELNDRLRILLNDHDHWQKIKQSMPFGELEESDDNHYRRQKREIQFLRPIVQRLIIFRESLTKKD